MRHLVILILLSLLLLHAPAGMASSMPEPQRKHASAAKKKTAKKTTTPKKSAKKNSTPKPRTAEDIKKARQDNARKISETRHKIKLNTKETEQRLNQLNLLEGEIDQYGVEIAARNASLEKINARIEAVSDSISTLDSRLEGITSQYVAAIRRSQGRKNQMSALAFIFSSESFSQAYRRLRALRQFNSWRDTKSREINAVRGQLDSRRTELASLREQGAKELANLNNSRAVLLKKQGETAALVDRLKREGGELRQIMTRRQQEASSLDAELDRIIAEEARRQEEARRKKEEADRQARIEEERRAREAEEARIAQEAREAEATKKAEEERKAAEKAEQEARMKAEQQRKAEAEAKTAQEKEVARKARKEAEQEAKKQRQAAEKAEKERQKAEKEAAQKAREESRKKAKGGKPVKHQGKNNGRGDAGKPSETETPASAEAPRLHTPAVAGGESGVASAKIAPAGEDFHAAKGQLPFPVEGHYTIVKRFGRQKHPTLPHVETNNSGIDIATARGAGVRSVFAGEVSAVFRPDGYNNVVVIRHGRHMTVYANLGTITVSTGQKVKAGQNIGTIYADPDDPSARSVLHFEIRDQRAKENPELWLRP